MKDKNIYIDSRSLNRGKGYPQDNLRFIPLKQEMLPCYSKILFCCCVLVFLFPGPCPSCTGDGVINYSTKKLPKLVKGTIKSNPSYTELIPLLL